MSTKIRQALLDYSRITGKADEALAELEAIERAAAVIAEQGIYESPEGESEETTARINDAYDVIDAIAKEEE